VLDRKTAKNEAMKQVRLVQDILRSWDPLNVEPVSEAPADEYDSYATQMVSMVRRGCTADELSAHLENIEIVTMGLSNVAGVRARCHDVAAQIVNAVTLSNNSLERR